MQRQDLCEPIRQRLRRYPPPYEHHYGVVPPPPAASVPLGATHAAVAQATQALTRLDTLIGALPHGYLASRVLLRQEAVASSTIEGTHSTLDELLALEEHSEGGGAADTRRVHRYALALEAALATVREYGPAAFTVEFIQALHRTLMTGDSGFAGVPGALRHQVVWIGGLHGIAYSTYNPTPPADIASCLEDQAGYLRGGGMEEFLPLPVKLAVAHAHFEAVHPFRDGNGRVGRLLIPLMLAAAGHQPLYVAPFIEAHKDRYFEALKEAQQRLNWVPLIEYMARALTESAAEVERTRTALVALPLRWLQGAPLRSGSAAARALPCLLDYPVLTVDRLKERLGISYQAANQAVQRLLAMKVLRERTGYKRNRIFVAEDVLQIINRPFGHAPILSSDEPA